jgi:hypothetical protein
MDFFDISYNTKANLLFKSKEKHKRGDKTPYSTKIHEELSKYKLGEYTELFTKLKRARDKYAVHTEKIEEQNKRNFPIKIKDLIKIEELFKDIEENLLSKEIKEEASYKLYKYDKNQTELLKEFDNLMNSLWLSYHLDGLYSEIHSSIDYVEEDFKKLQNLQDLCGQRAKQNVSSKYNIFLDNDKGNT